MTLFTNKTFVIAEMANSHEGDIKVAKKIAEAAAKAGADAIKFQKFTPDELAEPDHEYYSLYQRLQMSLKEWKGLIDFAKSKKLKVFVDVFGLESAKQISKLNIDGYKIHSADISNPQILKFLSNVNKPVLLSVAGCLPNEIDTALNIIKKTPKEIVLMHGFQGYPTQLEDLNLSRITSLKAKFGLPVGLMDHVAGGSQVSLLIPSLGVSLGAAIIEKHITLDRSKKGLDYYSALNPGEFKKMISLLRTTEKSLGNSTFELVDNELKYRLVHKKNSIAKIPIKKGTKLHEGLFDFKRTKKKQHSVFFYDYNGRMAAKNIAKGTVLTNDMLDKKIPKVAAVIACRVGSERLFAKPLQRVGGFTILELYIKQIQKSKIITEIVLAISEKPGNEVFVNFALEHNLKFIIGDDMDVLKRLVDGAKYVNADVVFRNTPDCPYIYWEGIDPLLKKHITGKYDFSIMNDVPLGAGYEIINTKALETSHLHGSKKHRSELASLYIYDNKRNFKIQDTKPPRELQRPDLRLTVDNPEDLKVARMIYDSIGKNDEPIPMKKIVNFLDDHPEITRINSHIVPGKAKLW